MAGFKKWIVILVICAFTVCPIGSSAMAKVTSEEERSSGTMIADLVLVRPLGLVSLVAGSAIFVVSLPISAAGKNINEAYNKMVVDPARHTFKRPLGGF